MALKPISICWILSHTGKIMYSIVLQTFFHKNKKINNFNASFDLIIFKVPGGRLAEIYGTKRGKF